MSETRREERLNPTIGEVYLMKFEGSNSEQHGWRPGVVFQNNTGNAFSPNVIALPLTSAIKKTSQPTHVVVSASDSGLQKDSMVLCENPEKMSKAKIGKFITKLSDEYMKKIAVANLVATAAISFLSEEDLLNAWHKSVRLNCAYAA